MSATQVDLREALKTAVTGAITLPPGTVVESRYLPRVDAEDVEQLHLAFMALDAETELVGRSIDIDSYVMAIVIQQKVPKARDGDTVHDGADNVTFVDEKVQFVESIKSLFRGNGSLRHSVLAGCRFDSMVQDMMLEPMHLAKYGVFTSIIELTFKAEED